MSLPRKNPVFSVPATAGAAISPVESMAYMGDLLENMRRIAQTQGLGVLAHLLELARTEARLIVRDQTPDQEPDQVGQGPRALGG